MRRWVRARRPVPRASRRLQKLVTWKEVECARAELPSPSRSWVRQGVAAFAALMASTRGTRFPQPHGQSQTVRHADLRPAVLQPGPAPGLLEGRVR